MPEVGKGGKYVDEDSNSVSTTASHNTISSIEQASRGRKCEAAFRKMSDDLKKERAENARLKDALAGQRDEAESKQKALEGEIIMLKAKIYDLLPM